MGTSIRSADVATSRRAIRRTDEAAELALEVFCYRIRKCIGAYLSSLEGAEAVVFTGGIGENAAEVRRRVCEPLGWIGLRLDAGRNARNELLLSADESPLAVYAIPTDEEGLIAWETVAMLGA